MKRGKGERPVAKPSAAKQALLKEKLLVHHPRVPPREPGGRRSFPSCRRWPGRRFSGRTFCPAFPAGSPAPPQR